MRYGHGTCTILQHSLKLEAAIKVFNALKRKKIWQSTAPKTTAKSMYGAVFHLEVGSPGENPKDQFPSPKI